MQVNKSVLADFQRLSECLSQFDELTIAEFCKRCESLNKEASVSSRRSSKVNEDLVEAYARDLADCVDHQGQFENVYSRLKADKGIRLGELNSIAHRFVGGTNKYTRASEALKDIKLRFNAHTTAQRRLDASSEIF